MQIHQRETPSLQGAITHEICCLSCQWYMKPVCQTRTIFSTPQYQRLFSVLNTAPRHIATTTLQQSTVIRHLLYFYAIVSKRLALHGNHYSMYILGLWAFFFGCWPGLFFRIGICQYVFSHFMLHKLFACIDPFTSIAQRWDLPLFGPVDFYRALLNPPDKKLVNFTTVQ